MIEFRIQKGDPDFIERTQREKAESYHLCLSKHNLYSS